MTTIQRLKSTRMAPYIGMMQELTPEEKHLVVMFLTEQSQGAATRKGWAAAAKQAHADGEDRLMAADVFEDETMEDWKW
ncbi:MAG: hypothetical protein IJ841_00435 [Prevotella sp.]|nr:hypothetical protein [Prevotella sp.]